MMAKYLVVLAILPLVAFAFDEDYVSAAAADIPYSPQEKFLSQQSVGNFACRVDSISVSTESPGTTPILDPKDIQAAFSQLATLEWAHIAQMSFGSFDGRNDEKILATGGGDMGEFINVLQAYTKVSGKALTAEEVFEFLERYLRVMSREKFSYQTDEKAYVRLSVATGCRNLRIADIGGNRQKKADILAQIALPEHLGDPFLKFLAKNATDLDINPEYIHSALSAYHNILWTQPSKLSHKLCYLETKGPHKEAALVHVKTPGYCIDQGLAPMVSPQTTCAAPIIINHPDAAKLLRREMVAVLTEKTDVDGRDVLAVANMIAESNIEKFWGDYGPNLATFTVNFQNSAPILTGHH